MKIDFNALKLKESTINVVQYILMFANFVLKDNFPTGNPSTPTPHQNSHAINQIKEK